MTCWRRNKVGLPIFYFSLDCLLQFSLTYLVLWILSSFFRRSGDDRGAFGNWRPAFSIDGFNAELRREYLGTLWTHYDATPLLHSEVLSDSFLHTLDVGDRHGTRGPMSEHSGWDVLNNFLHFNISPTSRLWDTRWEYFYRVAFLGLLGEEL